ncbi:serine carboxypeptidase-like 1 [Tripterygium wilfordii]|uniref:serine carboxypeptidase-like 1 n=1 Tax=Tripterygium wilfordii TaxID=458696 RepID=UPI0018F81D25|nr:serine carboxypeptidase-like 1 [Tripterygium wilfordii]
MQRSSTMSKLHLVFLLLHLVLLLHVCFLFANSHSVVKSLPGFQGKLPFYLETGYVGVGEAEDVQLFYYFVESDGNPKEDPLLLWLTGGPGCSALSGLVYEIGPINFEINVEYNGSLPSLVLNPSSWTKVSNIIFVDSPVGTGFSYATSPAAAQSSDSKNVHHSYQFLMKWLMDHPEFLSNPVYIAGDSYSGLIIPPLVQQVINGNQEGSYPPVNLQGYIIGNGLTDSSFDDNSKIPFAHGMGLISDELYESLKRNCKGEYINIVPSNQECLENIRAYDECTSRINAGQILEPLCAFASPKPGLMFGKRRSLSKSSQDSLKSEPSLPDLGCHTYRYFLSPYWVNDYRVRKALHIREGTVETWVRCNYGLPYMKDIPSSFQYHVNLAKRNLRSLIYSGDHDMMVPFLGTQAWIRALNYSIVDEWRPWFLQGQVAGYSRTYSNNMTFATVKGGGHTAPEYKPAECFAMFKRWMKEEAL